MFSISIYFSKWMECQEGKGWHHIIVAFPCLPCRFLAFSHNSRCGITSCESVAEGNKIFPTYIFIDNIEHPCPKSNPNFHILTDNDNYYHICINSAVIPPLSIESCKCISVFLLMITWFHRCISISKSSCDTSCGYNFLVFRVAILVQGIEIAPACCLNHVRSMHIFGELVAAYNFHN